MIWVYFGKTCDGRCWYTLWPFRLFGMFCGLLVYLLYGYLKYVSRFGMLDQEKSGNPAKAADAKISSRVARCFLAQHTKTVKVNVYQFTAKYTK
jgi:hypothetical protein